MDTNNYPWRVFHRTGQTGMVLAGTHPTKAECIKQVTAQAAGAIVRMPNTRDYVISPR
jgi:hypothetical protein